MLIYNWIIINNIIIINIIINFINYNMNIDLKKKTAKFCITLINKVVHIISEVCKTIIKSKCFHFSGIYFSFDSGTIICSKLKKKLCNINIMWLR